MSRTSEARVTAGLPTDLDDIHRRSLDRRGRRVRQEPLPATFEEIHAIALERNRRH